MAKFYSKIALQEVNSYSCRILFAYVNAFRIKCKCRNNFRTRLVYEVSHKIYANLRGKSNQDKVETAIISDDTSVPVESNAKFSILR